MPIELSKFGISRSNARLSETLKATATREVSRASTPTLKIGAVTFMFSKSLPQRQTAPNHVSLASSPQSAASPVLQRSRFGSGGLLLSEHASRPCNRCILQRRGRDRRSEPTCDNPSPALRPAPLALVDLTKYGCTVQHWVACPRNPASGQVGAPRACCPSSHGSLVKGRSGSQREHGCRHGACSCVRRPLGYL